MIKRMLVALGLTVLFAQPAVAQWTKVTDFSSGDIRPQDDSQCQFRFAVKQPTKPGWPDRTDYYGVDYTENFYRPGEKKPYSQIFSVNFPSDKGYSLQEAGLLYSPWSTVASQFKPGSIPFNFKLSAMLNEPGSMPPYQVSISYQFFNSSGTLMGSTLGTRVPNATGSFSIEKLCPSAAGGSTGGGDASTNIIVTGTRNGASSVSLSILATIPENSPSVRATITGTGPTMSTVLSPVYGTPGKFSGYTSLYGQPGMQVTVLVDYATPTGTKTLGTKTYTLP